MNTGVYLHYKGGFYQALGVAEHSETQERLVVYVALSGADLPGPRLRVRPEAMFHEIVRWPSGQLKPRFQWIGDEIMEHRPLLDREIRDAWDAGEIKPADD